MFGFGGSDNARMPKTPHTFITPDNYGYYHAFLDDDSRMLLEWERNGGIPTPELAERAKKTASERAKQARLSKQLKRDLSKLSKSNAEIVKNLSGTKSTIAQGNKKQYISYSNQFGVMDKIDSDLKLTKAKRNQKLAEIKETFDDSIANLRNNRNSRQKAVVASEN